MHIGLVGLGRMGNNMRARLRNAGIEVTGYDANPAVSDVADLGALAAALPEGKRLVWVMVPHGKITDDVITDLAGVLGEGDLVIDGGNSKWLDDTTHAEQLAARGIRYMDAGVSGGVWGKDNGYGLVHNGIEYAIMQAYGEGYELLEAKDLITDVPAVFAGWQRGTVVRSWLLDLMVLALNEDPKLDELEGYVEDSGEGRWTLEEGIELAVPMPALSASIFARFVSRQGSASPTMKAVAALRNQFGGHAVKKS
ncbi:MAG: gnd [Microbacterium sp.]|nr:gnd [Microbacterium sp.]